MSRIKSTDTKPEWRVRRLVHGLGFRYRLHRRDLPGTPDLAFSPRRKVIFVHGCFWHGHSCGKRRVPATHRAYWVNKIERNVARDRRTRRSLHRAGWRVLVVWECQLRDLARLTKRIVRFLNTRDH